LENLKGRDYLEELDVNGKIALEWILGKQGELDAYGSGQGPVAGSYKQGNEPLGSIKVGEFLD
jgi:hypothetical protein